MHLEANLTLTLSRSKVNLGSLLGPTTQILHTKSQGHRPSGSGEDFKGFLPYMGVAAILVM